MTRFSLLTCLLIGSLTTVSASAKASVSTTGKCYSNGEVKYVTFDGAELLYRKPLPCSYEVVKVSPPTPNGYDNLWVAVKDSVDKASPKGATYTGLVHVTAAYHEISLRDHDIVFLDSIDVTDKLRKDIVVGNYNVTVGRRGSDTFIERADYYSVTYHGRGPKNNHKMTVRIFNSDLYRERVKGVCGNWDGNAENDFIPEGEHKPTKDIIKIFNSHILDTSSDEKCW